MTQWSTNPFDLFINSSKVKETYINLIHDTHSLVGELMSKKREYEVMAARPSDRESIKKARSLHFQIMILLSINAEYLLKAILLKRGYVINQVSLGYQPKFNEEFRTRLGEFSPRTQGDLNQLYIEATLAITPICSYTEKLISLETSSQIFEESNSEGYYETIGTMPISTGNYLGKFNELSADNFLQVIKKIRNRYPHRLESYSEIQGIPWYLYNFILWAARKEFPNYFEDLEYVGSDDVKTLFER